MSTIIIISLIGFFVAVLYFAYKEISTIQV